MIQQVDALYKELDKGNRRTYKDLFIARYTELCLWLQRPVPKRIDEIADIYMTRIMFEPDPVTRYSYDTEVTRKRDRAKEAIICAPTKLQKQDELEKALRFWAQQTDQYADIISDEATIKAFEDAGIKKVVWHTQDDEKVCVTCHERDKQSFPITKIPTKPHWRCRCWISTR